MCVCDSCSSDRLSAILSFCLSRTGLRQSVAGPKYTWCLTSTETIRFIKDSKKVGGRVGGGGMEVGGEEVYVPILHFHYQNDSCNKMGSDESHFNFLIVRDKVTRQCPQAKTLGKKGEPKRIRSEVSVYQPNALPLGQTGCKSCRDVYLKGGHGQCLGCY